MPEWFLEEPALDRGDAFFIKAFYRLSTGRNESMGLGPIPWLHVVEYADRAGLDAQMTEAFASIIEIMDAAFRKWHDANKPKTTGKTGNMTK